MTPFQFPATLMGRWRICPSQGTELRRQFRFSTISNPKTFSPPRAAQGRGSEHGRCYPFTSDGTFWPGSPVPQQTYSVKNKFKKNNSGQTAMILTSGWPRSNDQTLVPGSDFHLEGTPPGTGRCVLEAGDWVCSWVVPASQLQKVLLLCNAHPNAKRALQTHTV